MGWNDDTPMPLDVLEVSGRGADEGDDAVELMEFEALPLSEERQIGVPVMMPELGLP